MRPVTLSDLFDIDTLIAHVRDGYVHEGADASDPEHHIFCYTPKTMYARAWDQVTRACRGLTATYEGNIRDGSVTASTLAVAPVTSRGIPKFFCVDTIADAADDADNVIISLEDDDEMVAQLQGLTVSERTPVSVADKLDGAMCVGYRDREGRLAVHTKGSFASDEARIANAWLRKTFDVTQLKALAPTPEATPVFEVITPQCPHVVSYGDTESLFYLGSVDNASGTWTPAAKAPADDRYVKSFDAPETMPVTTLGDALRLPARDGAEGVVVTVYGDKQRLLKVKYDAFLELQRLRNASATSQKQLLAALVDAGICTSERLESLTDTELARLCGIEASSFAPQTRDATRRIALAAARPLLEAARPLVDETARASMLVDHVFQMVDLRGGTEQDYVSVVLERVAPKDRQLAFSYKKLYLERRRQIVEALVKAR